MRQLNKIESMLFATGALMMVIGVGCYVFGIYPSVSSGVFAVGAFLFALLQMSQTYEGSNFVIRRLRRTMVLGDICFIISALLMLENVHRFLFPYIATTIDGYNNYLHYVHNNWVVTLFIGAIIEVYTTHRISRELEKEEE